MSSDTFMRSSVNILESFQYGTIALGLDCYNFNSEWFKRLKMGVNFE